MTNLYQALADLNFQILSERAENGYWIWIGGRGDSSVGIPDIELTPPFPDENELMKWLDTGEAWEYANQVLRECFGGDVRLV